MRVTPCLWNKKIICVFAIWLLTSICLLCVSYYYSLTLPSFFCFFVSDWFNYDRIKFWLVFFFLLFGRTVEFPKFMLAFLVAVLISWFRWSRVFFVLIIFCILYCSPLVIWFFLTRNSASASVFTFLYLFCLCLFSVLLLLLLLLLCFLSCLGFLSTGTLQDSVVVLLRYQPLFVSKMSTDFCFLGVVFP